MAPASFNLEKVMAEVQKPANKAQGRRLPSSNDTPSRHRELTRNGRSCAPAG
jgi:hypothetical protein